MNAFLVRPLIAIGSNDVGRKGRARIPSVLASFDQCRPVIARLVVRLGGSGPCYIAMMASPTSVSSRRTVFGGDGADNVGGTIVN